MNPKLLAPVAVLIFFSAYLLVECSSIQGGAEIYLTSLGTVEGKSFFYDRSASRNWVQARQYCEEYGMELATITTEVQLQYLKSKHNATGFNSHHWIGLRNARNLSAMAWDDTDLPVGNLTTAAFANHATDLICGAYRSQTAPALEIWPCTTGSLGVLCQT
ncbi:unnamed protein product [Orchesella dallaii]|uniref:C-type lectin domain-containing protein n=1 Tax=Orchesella dallaii TaxID=48710 RepID=A0ABP1RLU4_9HEXA